MTEEQKRQYEAVFSWLNGVMDLDERCTEELCEQWRSNCGRCVAHQILSDPRIAIVDEDQGLPPNPNSDDYKYRLQQTCYSDGQEDMKDANFIKVIPKEVKE